MSPPLFLVTAGNTREKIDQVRDWGNIFTGKTGYDIALALSALGPVHLLSSNQDHLAAVARRELAPTTHPIYPSHFTTHAELKYSLAALLGAHSFSAVFMSAAVSDYSPHGAFALIARAADPDTGEEIWRVRSAQAGKIKSNHPQIAILGQQTEKLVDLFRTQWKYQGLLFKFKLEVGLKKPELLQVGRQSRRASGADYLIANTLDMVAGPKPGAYIISARTAAFVPRAQLASRLTALVQRRLKLPRA